MRYTRGHQGAPWGLGNLKNVNLMNNIRYFPAKRRYKTSRTTMPSRRLNHNFERLAFLFACFVLES